MSKFARKALVPAILALSALGVTAGPAVVSAATAAPASVTQTHHAEATHYFGRLPLELAAANSSAAAVSVSASPRTSSRSARTAAGPPGQGECRGRR